MSVYDSNGRELQEGQRVTHKRMGFSPTECYVKEVCQPGSGSSEGYVVVEMQGGTRWTLRAPSKNVPIREVTIV